LTQKKQRPGGHVEGAAEPSTRARAPGLAPAGWLRLRRVPGGKQGADAGSCTATPSDVAIVDIGLPGMDGFSLARALRQDPKMRTRLVAMTGYGQAEDRRRALDAGFEAHVVKPVELDDLLRLLQEQP